MGLTTSALTTGRNALLAYQGALQVVGNNVANSANPDYVRQSGDLTPVNGARVGAGLQPGAGVTLSALRRHVDEALENRLRTANGEFQSATARRQALAQIEVFFNDASGAGISGRLTEFFTALSDVQNAPDDLAIRAVAISTAEGLAASLRSARANIRETGDQLNGEIERYVEDGNRIASEIAELNTQIVTAEAGGKGQVSALRNRRDSLLRELSQIFDVQVREQPGGAVIVYVGSEPLVQYGVSRGLTTEVRTDGEFARASVRFADTNAAVQVAGGVLEGLIQARDQHAYARLQTLDQLAAGIIDSFNEVHADGQGLTPLRSITSQRVVTDPAAPLNSLEAGLATAPVTGSFFLTVTDDLTGTPVSQRIAVDLDGVDPDTSLNDIVTQINDNVDGVTASVTPDNRLSIVADAGFSLTFGHDGEVFRQDTSGLLAALGMNTFFSGSSAADIAVRPEMVADPGLLAAATVNVVGDGNNAGRLSGLLNESTSALGGVSILDFYNRIANGVATDGSAARNDVEASEAVAVALSEQRQAVSGVSLDEEAIDLLKFERAFQGAARYVSVVDRLTQEMISLAG